MTRVLFLYGFSGLLGLFSRCSYPGPAVDAGVSDSDPSGDTETVSQSSVTIGIVNTTSQVAYLNQFEPIKAVYDTGPIGLDVALEAPYCTPSCDDVELDELCCMDCSTAAAVIGILPGDTLEYEWNGSLYWTNWIRCLCGCYDTTDPYVGDYLAEIEVYDSVECSGIGCTDPEESGIWYNRELSGESRTFEAGFSVPVEGEAPIIYITEE